MCVCVCVCGEAGMKRRLGESGNEEQGAVGKDKRRGGDSGGMLGGDSERLMMKGNCIILAFSGTNKAVFFSSKPHYNLPKK